MTFSKETTFLGRNGVFKATGVELTKSVTGEGHSVIVIEPITSRGVCGRSNIEVPTEDIPALIAKLQTFLPHAK